MAQFEIEQLTIFEGFNETTRKKYKKKNTRFYDGHVGRWYRPTVYESDYRAGKKKKIGRQGVTRLLFGPAVARPRQTLAFVFIRAGGEGMRGGTEKKKKYTKRISDGTAGTRFEANELVGRARCA